MEAPVPTENPSGISFSPQSYVDTDGHTHDGEKLTMRGGYTGYVEWNTGELSGQGTSSARMMVVGKYIEIYVDEELRRKNIGRTLLEGLVDRLRQQKFNRLVILGVTSIAKGFYDKSLQELRRTNLIKSFRSTPGHMKDSTDYLYEISF